MTNQSDALRVVAGLAEKATPGEWIDGGESDPTAVLSQGCWCQVAQANDVLADCKANVHLIVAAVNFIREHGAALAQALEDSARLDFVLEQLGADEASALFSNKEMMAEEVRANIDAAIAAQQKEAANA